MKVAWLREASKALDLEYEYLVGRNPKVARLFFRRIVVITKRFQEFPVTGQRGHVQGARELVVPGAPYVIVHRVGTAAVEILRVFHTSRDWPELMQ
jgi:toxin ParE1/3/4